MSMAIIHHVRQKSQAKGSARTLLFNLALYANDCCGVAWPSDATLFQDVNVSRQRIHALKNALEAAGELVIVERPGTTNLYFVAWQGQPLGLDGEAGEGPSRTHQPGCPLRQGGQPARPPRSPAGVSQIPDPASGGGVSRIRDPQGSHNCDRGCHGSVTQQLLTTREKTESEAVSLAQGEKPATTPTPRAPRTPSIPAYPCGVHGCARLTCAHSYVCAYHGTCSTCQAAAP
jgi:hypothetical protein